MLLICHKLYPLDDGNKSAAILWDRRDPAIPNLTIYFVKSTNLKSNYFLCTNLKINKKVFFYVKQMCKVGLRMKYSAVRVIFES